MQLIRNETIAWSFWIFCSYMYAITASWKHHWGTKKSVIWYDVTHSRIRAHGNTLKKSLRVAYTDTSTDIDQNAVLELTMKQTRVCTDNHFPSIIRAMRNLSSPQTLICYISTLCPIHSNLEGNIDCAWDPDQTPSKSASYLTIGHQFTQMFRV